VAGAKVTEADERGELRGPVTTDAEGRFRFRNRRARQSI
jgi:hypothetical protein